MRTTKPKGEPQPRQIAEMAEAVPAFFEKTLIQTGFPDGGVITQIFVGGSGHGKFVLWHREGRDSKMLVPGLFIGPSQPGYAITFDPPLEVPAGIVELTCKNIDNIGFDMHGFINALVN